MKIYVIIAMLVAVCSAQQTTCDDVRFQYCTNQMAGMLQMNATGFWNDPNVLRSGLQAIFTRTIGDINSLVMPCNAQQLFFQCLGPQNIGLCLGFLGFLRRGRTPAQAYAFDGILEQQQHMCSTGFFVSRANMAAFSCMQRVTANFDSTLQTCYQTYLTNIDHEPALACTYAATLLSCYQTPFRTNCMPDQQIAGWWSCETQRRYASIQFPTCTSLTCALTPTRETLDYIDRHSKVDEHNVQLYKIPAKWIQDIDGQWKFVDSDQWIGN